MTAFESVRYPTSRVSAVANVRREKVLASNLDGRSVAHYSIPNVQERGAAVIEDGGTIDSDKWRIRRASVLVSKLNPRKQAVAIAHPHSELTVASTEFVVLEVDDRSSRTFLHYSLTSPGVASYLNALTTSATRSHQRVQPEDIEHLRIPWPAADIRRRIVDYLDNETAEIDALVADLEIMKVALIERRSATVAHAFNEHRGLAPLKRYGELQSGLTLGATYVEPTEVFKYLRVANVQSGHVTLDEVAEVSLPPALARRYMLRAGDVLLTEGGDRDKLGRGALWMGQRGPMLHQNHIFAFRCSSRLLPEYLVYALEAPNARRYFDVTARQSTNLASTNASIVLAFPLHVPNLTAQRSIIKHLDLVISEIAAEIADIDAAIALAKERRAALITAAVTGQIDVTTKQARAVDSIQTAIEDAR